jgi:hypothetical protein
MMNKISLQLKHARNRGVPLIAVTTPDQPAMARKVCEILGEDTGIIEWDSIRGPRKANDRGGLIISSIFGSMDPSAILRFADFVTLIEGAPRGSVIVVHNAHRLTDDLANTQGIANLRDQFGGTMRTLVLLAPMWTSPVELGSDVYVISESVPNDRERAEIIRPLLDTAVDCGATIDDIEETLRRAVSATRGLSPFVIEQTISLSLRRSGLSEEETRRRFVEAINSTPGLTYFSEIVDEDEIGGLENFKSFARALSGAKAKPRAVVFVDEIEKAVAGSTGQTADTSGSSQAILGSLLTWMQDHGATGMIAVGPPGSGKSMSAKALGGVCGIPTIAFDLGALKGSLVGQTEQQTRYALDVIREMAGEVFFIATCNNESGLPPELRRRFKQGIWFFDLPTEEERNTIWKLYLDQMELDGDQAFPVDDGWTGAEIRACCESAWNFNISLLEASQWIVPVAKSAADQIDSLRRNADQRYISASHPGAYEYQKVNAQAPSNTKRQINFDGEEV